MDDDDLDKAHDCGLRNRHRAVAGVQCGCYFCLGRFDGSDIWEWMARDDTAFCPRCGIDAVLTHPEDDLSRPFLPAMCKRYFGQEWADGVSSRSTPWPKDLRLPAPEPDEQHP